MAIKKTLPNPPSKIDDHESLVMAIHFRIMPTLVRTDGKKYKTLPVKLKALLSDVTGGCSADYDSMSKEKRQGWWHSHYGNLRFSYGDKGREGGVATQERMEIAKRYWDENEDDALTHSMMCLCKNADEERLRQIIELLGEDLNSWLPFVREHGQECTSALEDEVAIVEMKHDKSTKSRFKIWAGIPGTGKSYNLNLAAESIVANVETDVFRTVFHPEYSFYDFVGQIHPRETDSGRISYPFVPGPFVLALRKAFKEIQIADIENRHPENIVLIIDELNRGNASAIFGEIFQLLDLDENGESKYGVHNHNIAKEIDNMEIQDIKIPPNFYIYASMNISDQNVFPLDTAFLRRWDREYTSAENWEGPCRTWQISLPNGNIKWEDFASVINNWIIERADDLGISNPEDKRLGPWFVELRHCRDLALFANKIIVYLWTNVFTHTISRRGTFVEDCKTLEGLLEKFLSAGLAIFESNLANDLNKLIEIDPVINQIDEDE